MPTGVYKMKRILSISLIILAVIFCAVGCKKEDSSIPEGLQVVKTSDSDGYEFYGPKGWSVANDGKVAASYISVGSQLRASITLATADENVENPKTYFESQKAHFAYEITVLEEPSVTLGNANGAYYSVIYSFNYNETDYSSWQILAKNGDDLFIFTYTAKGAVSDEESDYQRYVEDVRRAIDAIKFKAKSGTGEVKDFPHGADGYKLVSDKKIAGFELYLPNSAEVVTSDAYVSAKLTDKANINLSRANDTGVGVLDYVKNRKIKLSEITKNVTDIAVTLKNEYDPESPVFDGWDEVMSVMPTLDPDICFGDINQSMIIAYEYTYESQGVKYHVYQVFGVVEGFMGSGLGASGFVFTYTATEDEYASHLDEIDAILQRIGF